MTAHPTLEIADYISRVTFDDLPEAAVANAKVAILDTFGVMLAGTRLRAGRQVVEYVAECGARPVATVAGTRVRTSTELAALANGVLAHVQDYDDRWHASVQTLPAALAAAEAADADGRELIVAYVIGREFRVRLDAQFRAGRRGDGDRSTAPGWRGWHETGVFGALGATAAAGHVLRLNADQTATAIGIGSSLASGLIANFGTSTKSLDAGNAARNGVLAASLAARGFTAEPTILTARRGLIEALCFPGSRPVEPVAASLRSGFHIADRGVEVKPYPCASGTHPYIETTRMMRDKYGLRPQDVTGIVLTWDADDTNKRRFATDELEAKFSPSFAVIATLIDGAVTLDNCQDDFLRRPDVRRLTDVTSYADSADGFVQISTAAGQVYREDLLPRLNYDTAEERQAKFYECAAPVIGPDAARELHEMTDRLESVGSVRELAPLLASDAC
jgi:2-methylcitrate dehydratase PrpD